MKSLDEEIRGGNTVAAVVVLALGLVLLVVLGWGLARCAGPRPSPAPGSSSAPVSSSSAAAIASSSAAVKTTITIRRKSPPQTSHAGEQQASEVLHGDMDTPRPSGASQSVSNEADEWEVTVTTEATASSSTSSTASASAVVDNHGESVDNSPRHGRLGVAAALMPGVLGVSFELARVEVPAGMVGIPVELGIDLVGNLQAAGAGISVGPGAGKAFGIVGAFTTYNGTDHGIMVGAGLRF